MATVKIVLKNKMKSSEYRVFMRISHLNQPAKYIKLPFKSKLNEWDSNRQRFKKNKPYFKELNRSLLEVETLSDTILSKLEINGGFTYEAFEKSFHNNGAEEEILTVNDAFIEKLKQLESSKRYGSYRTYSNCYSSLLKFTSLDIRFEDIDYRFLKEFEQFHIQIGNKPNSYAGYFRILRAMHYEYCKLNNIPQPEIYKDFNISRLKNETRKKSLSKDQLKAFIAYEPPSEAQKQAKLIFLFSFYARGINLMDMLQLTRENIENNTLLYRRQKTGKQLQIKLIKEAQLILEHFKNDSDFLFPYLNKGQVPKYRVRDVNANVNRRLKLIGKIIGVNGLSMYYARHTFAELNYKAGVRIEIISQMLGHSDLKVTQTYLRQFSDDEVDEAASTIFDSI